MKASIYQLKGGFAKRNNILVLFTAVVLKETERGIYLYGHGSSESKKVGICMHCARTLTHPVSVELGIGPECGRHYWDWDMIGGYTPENIERLKGELLKIKIDQWFPKSQIAQIYDDCLEDIEVPNDHPILNQINKEKETVQDMKARLADLATDEDGNKRILIRFPFDFPTIDKIKTLVGRKFHPQNKCWSAPITSENIEALRAWNFIIDQRLEQYTKPIAVEELPGISKIKNFKGILYPYQAEGVAFLEKKNGRALIADEMGLGKTIQALAWLQLRTELRPVIIVVPATLKLNWKKEIKQWMGNNYNAVTIIVGTKPYTIPQADIIIINYDILDAWVDRLLLLKPKVLITDECHYYKSNQAQRTKAVKKLGKNIPHIIALSGTPIVNRPIEIFNAIHLIDSAISGNFWSYAQRYCGAVHNGYGWSFNGATNTQELNERLKGSIMIRRLKKNVLQDLPDKIYNIIPIELDNQDEYNKAEGNFISFLRLTKGNAAAEKASNAEALTEVEGLKQLAVKGKLKAVINWVEDFLETDNKLVLFANHKFVIDTLMDKFKNVAVKIDGSVSSTDRQKMVDAFQNNSSIRLFVGNIKAAGVGITLTASSNVAIIELPWTPGDLSQAEDRCHRIGQKESVTIHYLLAADTIEERIARLIDKKRKVLDAVLDGIETDNDSLLSELMKEYV